MAGGSWALDTAWDSESVMESLMPSWTSCGEKSTEYWDFAKAAAY